MSRDFMVGEGVNEADLDAELAGLDMDSIPNAAPAGAAAMGMPQQGQAVAGGAGMDAELAALDAGAGGGGWNMPAVPSMPTNVPAQPARVPTAAAGSAAAYGRS